VRSRAEHDDWIEKTAADMLGCGPDSLPGGLRDLLFDADALINAASRKYEDARLRSRQAIATIVVLWKHGQRPVHG